MRTVASEDDAEDAGDDAVKGADDAVNGADDTEVVPPGMPRILARISRTWGAALLARLTIDTRWRQVTT